MIEPAPDYVFSQARNRAQVTGRQRIRGLLPIDLQTKSPKNSRSAEARCGRSIAAIGTAAAVFASCAFSLWAARLSRFYTAIPLTILRESSSRNKWTKHLRTNYAMESRISGFRFAIRPMTHFRRGTAGPTIHTFSRAIITAFSCRPRAGQPEHKTGMRFSHRSSTIPGRLCRETLSIL